MQKIIINGANGFVASHFILGLLQHNYEVIAFVRRGKKQSAQQRMKDGLNEICMGNETDYKHLKVYNYSLLEEDYSLTKEQLETIFDGKVHFFHFAACLKFSTKHKDEIFKTNVDGLKNSIQLFKKNAQPGSQFFFISTAYSCGKFSGLFKEEFYPNQEFSHFRNYYEQSKRFAENVLKESIESGKLNGHVVRLSQVVGNNKTGITKTDYGIFDLAKRLCKITSLHPNNTLRIKVDPNGTQNLIPINYVVDTLVKIPTVKNLPHIINLTAQTNVKNETIAQCINRQLPTTIILDKNLKKKDMNSLERMITLGMSFTGKYTHANLLFERKNLDEIMLPDGSEVTKDSLCKMMDYFIRGLNDENPNVKNFKTNN